MSESTKNEFQSTPAVPANGEGVDPIFPVAIALAAAGGDPDRGGSHDGHGANDLPAGREAGHADDKVDGTPRAEVSHPAAGGPGDRRRVTDALAKWEADTARTPANVAVVRLDGNDRTVIPFTTNVVEVVVHYVEYPSIFGYLRCNGVGCLLCIIGRQAEKRDLLPVFDPVAKQVGVLSISQNLRPAALRPQLMPVLRRVAANEREVVILRSPGRGQFIVSTVPFPAGIDDGAAPIARFLRGFDANEIDLASAYQQLGNEELAVIPEIATIMAVRGITL